MAKKWHSPGTELMLNLVIIATAIIWVVVFTSSSFISFVLAASLLAAQYMTLRRSDRQRYEPVLGWGSNEFAEQVFLSVLSMLAVRACGALWADPAATWYVGVLVASVVVLALCTAMLMWLVERTMWGQPFARALRGS